MAQVRDRTRFIDATFSDAMSQFGSDDQLGPDNLQLQLPDRGKIALPRPGQSRQGLDGSQSPGRPQLESPGRPQIDQRSRPQPEIPAINPPSRPFRRWHLERRATEIIPPAS